MKFLSIKMWLPLLLAVALTGCAGMKAEPLSFTLEGYPAKKYDAKANNYQIIMDASSTMAKNGNQNFQTEQNFVKTIIWALPSDYPANTGLRTFGHDEKQSSNLTDLVAPMAKFSRDEMRKGLDKVKVAGGTSPLGTAINAAAKDLESAEGTSRLVIVSDGTQNTMDDALAAAKAIKAKMGDKLCIYTVWVGDDMSGKKYLDGIATAGGCGSSYDVAAMTDQKAFAGFMETVFLTKKPEPMAPAPPPPAPAPAPMVAPAPAPCKGNITANLIFDFDKATIKDDMIPALEEAKRILAECPATNYELSGHTCSIGTDAYNQKLSERRADAVKKWLVDNGVAAGRLDAVGYGESQPKYDNKAEEGRKLNRRVVFQAK